RLNPDNAAFFKLRGDMKRLQQKYREARADYNAAIILLEDDDDEYDVDPEIVKLCGNMEELLGEYRAAIRSYKDALALKKDHNDPELCQLLERATKLEQFSDSQNTEFLLLRREVEEKNNKGARAHY